MAVSRRPDGTYVHRSDYFPEAGQTTAKISFPDIGDTISFWITEPGQGEQAFTAPAELLQAILKDFEEDRNSMSL